MYRMKECAHRGVEESLLRAYVASIFWSNNRVQAKIDSDARSEVIVQVLALNGESELGFFSQIRNMVILINAGLASVFVVIHLKQVSACQK